MFVLFLFFVFGDIVFIDDFRGSIKWNGDIDVLNCTNSLISEYDLKCPNVSEPYLYFNSYPYSSTMIIFADAVIPTYSCNVSIQILYYGQNFNGQNITVTGYLGGYYFPNFPIFLMEGWTYSTVVGQLPNNLENDVQVGLKFTYDNGNSPGFLQVVQIVVTVINYYPQPISPVMSTSTKILLACGTVFVLIVLAITIVALIRNRCRVFAVCSCRKKSYFSID